MGNTTSSYDNDNITISTANIARISPTPFKYKFMNGPSGKSLMDEIVDFISERLDQFSSGENGELCGI